MFPFTKQHSVPLGARLDDSEKESKVVMHPSVSSSPSPLSLSPSSSSPQLNRNRTRSILALALTLTLLVLVSVATTSGSKGSSSLPSQHDEAEAPRFSSTLSSSSSSPPPLPRRRPLPSADAAVVAAALASADEEDNKKSDDGFPLAVLRSPLLTQAELLTLQHYARGSVYAEWGSGASTVLAAPMARRAVSIENQVRKLPFLETSF